MTPSAAGAAPFGGHKDQKQNQQDQYHQNDAEQRTFEELLHLDFTEGCLEEVRTKIYCYIAICGFLWSNWCEYKRILGVEFGEYSLKQYRYAKEFYRLAKERMEND